VTAAEAVVEIDALLHETALTVSDAGLVLCDVAEQLELLAELGERSGGVHVAMAMACIDMALVSLQRAAFVAERSNLAEHSSEKEALHVGLRLATPSTL
jgi:hypothetical protein